MDIPGITARTSLKHRCRPSASGADRDIPGITARTSLKARSPDRDGRGVLRHSGHHCPDLIEGEVRRARSAIRCDIPGITARTSLKPGRQHGRGTVGQDIPGMSARTSLKPQTGRSDAVPLTATFRA